MAAVAHHANGFNSLQTKITPAELGKIHCGLYDLWTSADHIPELHQELSTFVERLKPLANPWLTLVVTISRMAGGPTIPWIVRQVWCFGII